MAILKIFKLWYSWHIFCQHLILRIFPVWTKRTVEKFRYEYFMDINAPAQLITAPAKLNIAPAQLITAPAQPPATGGVVYTALFLEMTNIVIEISHV